ncbi:uncharacterized protein LOC129960928 isoform X2 [Argiope bruennichi]|uniref:uncharacterized protein LOC129960928 isoform X2 n=1 Tax=Argiope bruennichi TaxID=94029 RepID=UPI00249583EC|nr:uncharacterized protein LOC129960928 isoform X2 [Argiope bruennichi]
MSSLCFICELPILSHQTNGLWPPASPCEEALEDGLVLSVPDTTAVGSTYHEDCLVCNTCGLRLAGSHISRARRFQNKIYCSLHYADVSGLSSGDEFMQKLRDYKRQSLGCAEARRKSSTTLQFPIPVQACPGNGQCEGFPHTIKVILGYWIECSGSNNNSNDSLTVNYSAQDLEKKFELISVEEETYEKYFYGTEHWNYFTNDEALGPVILSIKQENVYNRDQFSSCGKLESVPEAGTDSTSSTKDGNQFNHRTGRLEADLRVMLRTVSYCLHGLVPASCICADRYDREAVVKALGDEAGLKPPLVLGQLSSTPDELLKLDQVFIKTELKVGVILVREGQQSEEQILDNQSHTPLFDEFLSILGDRIRLKGFDKYKGGLDSVHDLTGTESVYTAWRGIEIMFHVSTMLPHEEHDPQKLQKKRHIGNDIVCVAFMEADDTLFSPTCIKSHFLHTFIVVKTSPSNKTSPTSYEVSVVSRDEVGAYKPYLWHRSKFTKDSLFREWLLTKIVNGERASYSAPKFARMQDRTRSQMLEDIVTNLQNHVETGQIPKPYRRGSWRPIGHMRPSSPLLDSVRDTFEGFEQLARDFGRAFQNNRHLCDVIFNVGQGKEKTRVYAVRAILGVRSRVFLEMLYGFTTGYGPCMVAQGESQRKDSIFGSIKSSNFLQVPDPHDTVRSKAPSSSPTVFRYFSRLGNWAGWGMGSRSKSPLTADAGLKRWQSKEKEKERRQSVAAAEVTLSMCADAGKVDRAKLSQTEFNIIEFDSETFMILMEYLQSGSCPLTCETIPGLICAAEHYDLPELLQACFHHAKQHFRLSVVCSMLNMLENYYWRYNSASELVNAILHFIDSRASQLFNRREYLELSESMFQMILGRDLNISEVTKFQVMLQWANYKIEMSTSVDPRELECIMNRLTRDLKLQKIPPQELIRVILPTKTISNQRILETLLYQADTGMYRIQQSHIEECRARTKAENSESLSWDILETKICDTE